jgi:hypothetical protein
LPSFLKLLGACGRIQRWQGDNPEAIFVIYLQIDDPEWKKLPRAHGEFLLRTPFIKFYGRRLYGHYF